MFRKQRPPDGPFEHADDCKVYKADPDIDPPWNEVETRHWVRTCQCSEQHWRAPEPARARLDPYDPKTSHHLGQCEFKDETNPDIIKVLLKVRPGLSPGYQWVECGSCQGGWQVLDYAQERVG
jgi:hypothetical protein